MKDFFELFLKRACLCLPFFALFMSPAQAETIEEILSKVIQTNPEILAAKAKLKATEELMMQANAG